MLSPLKPLSFAMLLCLVGCNEAAPPANTSLSAPTQTSTSGVVRRASAATTTATSGPVQLSLELLNVLVPDAGHPAYFRATLTNIGDEPFEFKPDFFKDPRFQPSRAGIFLEAVGPNGSNVTRLDYLPSHRAADPNGYTNEQRTKLERLRAELDSSARRNRKSGLDNEATLIAHKSNLPSLPLLTPKASVETDTWVSPEMGTPAVAGYAQLPFFLTAPGKYKLRLVFDFTSRSGPAPIRVETPWLLFEVSRR